MRIREKPLDVWIIMRPDGSVDSAHCTCMAGLDECCSHVAAVLLILESATKAKRETSVTDTPAYWMFLTGARLDVPYDLKKWICSLLLRKGKCHWQTQTANHPQNDTEETDFLGRKISFWRIFITVYQRLRFCH